MKSTTIATALLATIAVAQPHHGHHRRHQREHEKREIVVEWETAWVTETVIVDETGTSTIPAATPTSEAVTSAYSAAQFYQTAAASETPKVQPSSEAPPPPPPAPTTPTTYEAPAPPTTLIPTTKAAPTTSAAPPPPPPVESTYVAPPPPAPPTTAEAPPPAPTTAEAPPPAPTTVQAPPPKPQPTSYPAEGGSDAPSGGAKKTGDITYYAPGMGSCGYDDSNPAMNVVAVSKEWFLGVSPLTNSGVNQPSNPLCDKTVTIMTDTGKKTTAVIRDSCPGCLPTALDVTEGAFLELFGSLDIGRGKVTWWLNEEVAGA